jgi:uncharacterized SAM-binding protein YcdF (DUF218 family)
VFTGGVAWGDGDAVDVSEARVIALFLARQDVPEGRVLLEAEARSTRDNAILALPLAQPKPGEQWLLVTSAAHMPRSIGAFRRAGWPEMVAWPVDYRTAGAFEPVGEPNVASRLDQLDQAVYEWYGLFCYWLLGYTDAIFPGPQPG